MATTLDIASSTTRRQVVDPRGQRFAAALTSVVLAITVLAIPTWISLALLSAQAIVFALGAALGPTHQPYASIFRRLVKARLGPPSHVEDAAPPRFAQGVGLVVASIGLLGLILGATTVALVAVGAALAAALLNATIGFCLGCEVYLLGLRATRRA